MIANMKVRALKRVLFVATCLVMSQHAQYVNGLRGCSSFGHSCFGAHGKRTELDVPDADTNIKPEMQGSGSEQAFDRPPPEAPFSSSQLAALARAKGYSPVFLRLLSNLASGTGTYTANDSQ